MSKLGSDILTLQKLSSDPLELAKMVVAELEGMQTYIKGLLKNLAIDPDDRDKNWEHYYKLKCIDNLQVFCFAMIYLEKERIKTINKNNKKAKEKLNENN